MKTIIGQIIFMLVVLFAAFGPAETRWVGYADNIVGFMNTIALILAVILWVAYYNIDELFNKSPPKERISQYFIWWNYTYYFIIVISYIMAGWTFSAIVWILMGIASVKMMEIANDVYRKLHPDDVDTKTALQEMADGDE